jgi:hypothetical protein
MMSLKNFSPTVSSRSTRAGGFEVEMNESPLSKVVVTMLKVTAIIEKQEAGAAFEAQIIAAANQLIGNYYTAEHNACTTLRHGQLNRVFELASVSYHPHPEPIARATRKCQAATTAVQLPLPKKTIERKKWKKTSSCSGDKTSEQEKALAKPLNPSKKFSVQRGGAQSSRLSISEKTSSVKAPPRPLVSAMAGRLKAPSASAVVDDSGYASVRAIDLYSSAV